MHIGGSVQKSCMLECGASSQSALGNVHAAKQPRVGTPLTRVTKSLLHILRVGYLNILLKTALASHELLSARELGPGVPQS